MMGQRMCYCRDIGSWNDEVCLALSICVNFEEKIMTGSKPLSYILWASCVQYLQINHKVCDK